MLFENKTSFVPQELRGACAPLSDSKCFFVVVVVEFFLIHFLD